VTAQARIKRRREGKGELINLQEGWSGTRKRVNRLGWEVGRGRGSVCLQMHMQISEKRAIKPKQRKRNIPR
jgi:hypothetical protein